MAAASCFLSYHLLVLLAWVGPKQGLSEDFHQQLLARSHARAYFRGTANVQQWAMFAPDPNRTNAFIRVLVTDAAGEVWDLGHDIQGERRWPYLWYDRGAKVNRRLDANKTNQRIYAAWVCREWERHHGGEAARSVGFVRAWTWVPEPEVVIAAGGWDPTAAEFEEIEQGEVPCATTIDAQLSDELRARYGLPPAAAGHARRAVVNESWWAEREARRLEAEGRGERDAARKRWQHRRTQGTPIR